MLQSAALGLRRKNLPCTSRHRRDLPRLGRRGKEPCCRESLHSPPLSSQPTFYNPLQSRRMLWLLQSLPRSVGGLWRSAKLCAGLRRTIPPLRKIAHARLIMADKSYFIACSFTLWGKPCYNRLALFVGLRLAVLWSAFAGRFLFCLGASGARGLGAVCTLCGGSCNPVRVLSGISGGLSLDDYLDLFPFDIYIIYHCASTFNMQIAQRYTLA